MHNVFGTSLYFPALSSPPLIPPRNILATFLSLKLGNATEKQTETSEEEEQLGKPEKAKGNFG